MWFVNFDHALSRSTNRIQNICVLPQPLEIFAKLLMGLALQLCLMVAEFFV